ncbi:hypothetical protein [Pseudoxanthomonas kaohsiungensis]|uniref:Type II secretion system protein GspF domain-containing protein n=1 Tax=Pseudoxanthomonas kaohsiungensis TaxID=283923 RepID=A0ABW3LZT0_9GAMM|nr:hypothetical protein [Pseudoxanthomonas kaohsiungensis]KAF1702932.1 hypothetical protein CSC66_09155 [Pseudoxanthomonas kaohsiungensis]
MNEEQKAPGLVSRVTRRTAKAGKGAAKWWMYSTVGDVPAEIEHRKRTFAWLKRLIARGNRGRVESFEQAMKRLGVSAAELQQRIAQVERMFYVYAIVGVAGLASLLLSPFVNNALSQFFMSAGVIGVCGAKAVVCRFRIYQMRERKFVAFGDWLLGRA